MKKLKTEIPEVDICIGTTAIDGIVSALDDYFKEHKKKEYLKDVDFLAAANAPRNLSTMGSYAYLKDCRRLRQALHILYYSKGTWKL